MDDALKQLVWDRAEDTCEYCRLPQRLDILPFQIDHVIAVKHQGATSADNLALCCYNDNSYKGPTSPGSIRFPVTLRDYIILAGTVGMITLPGLARHSSGEPPLAGRRLMS